MGPPQIETMMAKDVVMCNTGECVAAGKRKYQPGAVMDVPVSPVSSPLSGPAREWREYVAGWGSGIVNITLTFPVNKMMFRQQLHGISAWDSAGQLRAEGLVSCPENIIESRKYFVPSGEPVPRHPAAAAAEERDHGADVWDVRAVPPRAGGGGPRLRHPDPEPRHRRVRSGLHRGAPHTLREGADADAGPQVDSETCENRFQILLFLRWSQQFRNTPHAFVSLYKYGVREYYRG